jgi:sortase (surface protein transpeptidase)
LKSKKRVGAKYVITYTKRNVSFLVFIIAMFLIVFLHLMYDFVELLSNKFYSNQIYSKEISNDIQTKKVEENHNVIVTKTNNKIQREIVKEYKENTWRIQIPKINLDIHIEEGTSPNILLKSVGHFEETSKWQGNVGLAAHNRGYQCNYFQNIKNLKIGDEIIYTTEKRKESLPSTNQ